MERAPLTLVLQILALGLSVLFGIAIVGKLDSWGAWSHAVQRWAPFWLPTPLATWVIPLLEGVALASLILAPPLGFLLAAALLAAFGVGAFILGQGEECGCLGAVLSQRLGPKLAIRNILLALLSGISAFVAQGIVRDEIESPPMPLRLVALVVFVHLLLFAEMRRTGPPQEQTREEG